MKIKLPALSIGIILIAAGCASDQNSLIEMPDKALGQLTPLEMEMVQFGDFKLKDMSYTVTFSEGENSRAIRLRKLHQGQNYNTAIQVFEKEATIEDAEHAEIMSYVQSLYHAGAHGKKFDVLNRWKARLESDYRKKKNGELEESWFDTYTDRFIVKYSAMLTEYATYYEVIGDYNEAIRYTVKAQNLSQQLPDFMGLNEFNFNYFAKMSKLYALTGNRVKLDYFIEKIKIYEPPTLMKFLLPDDFLERARYDTMIRSYLAIGDYPAANNLISARAATTEGEVKTPGVSWGLSVLTSLLNPAQGVVSLADNVATEARLDELYQSEQYQQAQAIREAFIPTKVAYEMGKYELARVGYDTMLANPVSIEQQQLYYTMLHDRGMIALHENDGDMARELLVSAIDILESQRSSFNSESSKIGFVGNKQQVYSNLVKLLIERNELSEAFRYVERSKARALVDMLAQKDLSASIKLSSKSHSQFAAYTAAQDSIGVTDFSISTKTRGLKLNKAKKMTQVLQRSAPELASLVSVDVPEVKEVQAMLLNEETLIEYYGNDQDLYAFVLNKNSIHVQKLNGNQLADSVKSFRELLSNPENQVHRQVGRSLYKRIIQPLRPYIKTSKLAIVPHGPLHYLPFSALSVDADKYMLDNYQIRILPSASVLLFLKPRSKQPRYMLALGNPDLKQLDLDLPGAQAEVEAIARDQKNIDAYIRDQASETLIKKVSSQYQRLHIASHGIFYADQPMRSSLLLARDGTNDGQLTVSEIYDLDLNLDLITLSACETGLGKIHNGDDVIGLNRGFLYAGANTVVASLWQVSDAATSDLMQLFYKHLNRQNKRKALHSAQITVKNKYQHPYYWAAFQMTGAVN